MATQKPTGALNDGIVAVNSPLGGHAQGQRSSPLQADPEALMIEIPMRRSLIALVALAACGDPPPINYPTDPPAVEEDTRLGPGDVIEIRVFQQEDMTAPYTVSSAGTITFPLIGQVKASDKTPVQLETEIRDRLADGYLQDPQVSILVKQSNSRKIDVFGQVRQPGSLAFRDGMTITEAISSAGGFTGMAKRDSVRVTRTDDDGAEERYILPVENIGEGSAPNFYMRPGDVVYVPERLF